MTNLYLTYDEWRTGGGIVEGMENDSWPDYEDTYIEFSPTSVVASRDDAGVFPEGFEVKEDVSVGDEVYLVIVRYSDGDTFSHTNGYWSILGATTDREKADALAKAVNADVFTGEEEIVTGYAYPVWRGYFSSLESCDVYTFVVK